MYLVEEVSDTDHGDRDDIGGEFDTAHVDSTRAGQRGDSVCACQGHGGVESGVDGSAAEEVKDDGVSLGWGVGGGDICADRDQGCC